MIAPSEQAAPEKPGDMALDNCMGIPCVDHVLRGR